MTNDATGINHTVEDATSTTDDAQEGVHSPSPDPPLAQPRRTSAEVLVRVLVSHPELNLTNKVFVHSTAIKERHGGAADVFKGHIIATKKAVAVKRLRLNIGGSEDIAKACWFVICPDTRADHNAGNSEGNKNMVRI